MRALLPVLLIAAAGCAALPAVPDALPPDPSPPAPGLPAPGLPAPGLYLLEDTLALGTVDGVRIGEGGLSGLDRLADGRLVAVTDRGPNLDAEAAAGRPAKRFPIPDYRPTLVTLDAAGGVLRVASRTPIRAPDGTPVSGRPPAAAGDADVETAFGPDGETLAPDRWGLDAEGVADAGDGTVWIAEEYRPSLWRVSLATGRTVERFLPGPEDVALDRPLPAIFSFRTANLGFEGVAVVRTPAGPRVVAALQGPLRLPGADANTPVARLLVLDPATGAAQTLPFALDGPLRKVGDVAALPDGRILLVEHGPTAAGGAWGAAVYALDLARGRGVDDAGEARPEDFGSAEAARAAGVALVPKALVLDLVAAGWPAGSFKPEGLVIDGRRLALVADNDYGLDAPAGDGRAVASGRPTFLFVVDLLAAP